jgi:hypothetical protein
MQSKLPIAAIKSDAIFLSAKNAFYPSDIIKSQSGKNLTKVWE